jgi:hypothetical protein
VQLERDSIQEYYNISSREVSELSLATTAKDREMELMEDNHRVELRVYQQKVKHLEYENKNKIKDIVLEGTGLLESEQETNNVRQKDLLRQKDQLKFEQMQLEVSA